MLTNVSRPPERPNRALNGPPVQAFFFANAGGDGPPALVLLATTVAANFLAYRPANDSDAPSLSGLAHRALGPHTLPGWTSSAIERLLRENSEQALRDYLKDAPFAYVCLDADSRVGFIMNKVPGLLSLLVVDPSRQRQGIGSHLVSIMLEHVAEVTPELGVVEVNATEYSLPFYQRLGFFPISNFIELEGCRFARLAVWRKNPLLRR